MKTRIIVFGVILCFIAGCDSLNENDSYFDRLETRAQSLIDEKQQLLNNDKLLTEAVQKLINEWEAYLNLEFQFASYLNDEQLDAFGKLMSAFYTSPSDTAARVTAARKIAKVLPPDKLEELTELAKKRDDIAKRGANLQSRIESHNQQIANHNRQVQAALGTLERERQRDELRSMQRTQILNTWLREQQRQKERREDHIWLHNELLNLRGEGGVYIIP